MDAPIEDSTADQALLCIGCGYDLRGLGEDGACPECGVSIARSAIGDRLAAADTQWLSRVCIGQSIASAGLRVCLWGIVVYLVLVFGALLVAVVLNVFMQSSSNAALEAIAMFGFGLVGLCALCGMAALTIGVIPLTARDPRSMLSEKPASARNLARGSLIALVLTVSAFEAVAMFWHGAATATFRISRLGILAAIITIALTALVTYLGDLLARTSRSNLEQECRKLANRFRWLVPLMALAIVPSYLATGAAPSWRSAASCVTVLLALALLEAFTRLNRIMREAKAEFWQCLQQSKTLPATPEAGSFSAFPTPPQSPSPPPHPTASPSARSDSQSRRRG